MAVAGQALACPAFLISTHKVKLFISCWRFYNIEIKSYTSPIPLIPFMSFESGIYKHPTK